MFAIDWAPIATELLESEIALKPKARADNPFACAREPIANADVPIAEAF